MENMQWLEFLDSKIVFLVAFTYVVGVFLRSTEKLDNKFIPLYLWVVAVIASIAYYLIEGGASTAQIVFNGLVQGTFVAAVAVWGNQVYSQLKYPIK